MSNSYDTPWLGKLSRGLLNAPFGFEQGDPLVICRNNQRDTIQESSQRLRLRAYYVGYNSNIGSRRHNKIIFDIHHQNMSQAEFVRFWHWVSENVMTCAPPKGAEIVFV